MFTGIVKGLGRIESVRRLPGLTTFDILLPEGAQNDLDIGASVAVDGVCLTVTAVNARHAIFDVMQETLTRTTLGELDTQPSGTAADFYTGDPANVYAKAIHDNMADGKAYAFARLERGFQTGRIVRLDADDLDRGI